MRTLAPHKTSAYRQSGVVLIITLIVLIAMTLAAIALVRSVDTSNLVAGNMAFKQGATQAGDTGAEAAITWLQNVAGISASYTDDPANGYYASSPTNLDATGNGTDPNRIMVDWDDNNCNDLVPILQCKEPAPGVIAAGAGFEAKYIIHRLCQFTGSPTQINPIPNNCANTATTVPGTPKSDNCYGCVQGLIDTTLVEYYRIVTRIKGPHNSLSYIETTVHF